MNNWYRDIQNKLTEAHADPEIEEFGGDDNADTDGEGFTESLNEATDNGLPEGNYMLIRFAENAQDVQNFLNMAKQQGYQVQKATTQGNQVANAASVTTSTIIATFQNNTVGRFTYKGD